MPAMLIGAGSIFASLTGLELQSALEFAVVTSCLKQINEGDFNKVNIGEVNKLVSGDGSGRIQG